MRRRRIIAFERTVAGILAAAALVAPVWPGAVTGQAAALPDVLSEVSGRRAYEQVLALSQRIGPHVAGTPEDRTSGEYIARRLTDDGYAVEWQEFQFPFFAVRAVALTVPASPSVALHPHAMLYSPSTDDGGITAELADAGIGRPEDIRGASLAGKIALIQRGSILLREKAQNAADAGAVAVLIYNSTPGDLFGVVSRDTGIPVVALSGAEGLQLLDLAHSGSVRVHLNVQTATEQRTSWTLIGTRPGTSDPHRVRVAGAHSDTVERAPAASDN